MGLAEYMLAPLSRHRRPNRKATCTSRMSTGTSTSGPITVVKATGEARPNDAIATAMASSKLLPAAVKAMAVVTGEVDAYIHGGGQYEWDSAAPVAVAAAAGLHTSRLDGSPLVYNNSDPWLPDLMVCRVEHAERLLDVVAQIEGER